MDQPAEPGYLDLRGYLTVLRRHKWTILLVTAVAVLAALIFSFQQTPIYASTAKIAVTPPTVNQTLDNVPITTLVNMETEREIAASVSVAEIVDTELETPFTPDELLEELDVGVPTNSQILEITYSHPDPIVAQQIAQAFADGYLEFKSDEARRDYTRLRSDILGDIEEIQANLQEAQAAFETAEEGSDESFRAQTNIAVYRDQITSLRTQLGPLSVIDIDPGLVFQDADLPEEPASPNHYVNGGLALFVGLALGVGLAFLRERLDDRLQGREDLEEAIGAPTLAIVPAVEGWRKRDHAELSALTTPKGTAAEAYRTLRTNVLFMAKDGDIKTIAVTSPSMDEGKSTTAANLAVSLAQADKRVMVVSGDLRKPRLHRFYGLNNDIGVTSVLLGRAALSDAVQRPLGVRSLRVIASGPVPTNPSELLVSERMDAFLDQLREVADFVVLDTPPVLAVADALILAPKVDAVVIVADAAATTRGAVRHLREQLAQVGGNVVGGVFNNFDPARAKYYSPYYRTYYTQRYQQPEGRGERVTIQESTPGSSMPPRPEDVWHSEDIWS
jgi:capsular exopolysaccharide synthesis family protein